MTHDQKEALALADRMVILNRETVVADLSAGELARDAVNGFAAQLLTWGGPYVLLMQ